MTATIHCEDHAIQYSETVFTEYQYRTLQTAIIEYCRFSIQLVSWVSGINIVPPLNHRFKLTLFMHKHISGCKNLFSTAVPDHRAFRTIVCQINGSLLTVPCFRCFPWLPFSLVLHNVNRKIFIKTVRAF